MIDKKTTYPVLDQPEGENVEESIESLERFGLKVVPDAVIMDDGAGIMYLLLRCRDGKLKWQPTRYD
jgi:hypothetical protein